VPAVALCLALSPILAGDRTGVEPARKVRGITVSTHTDGREWGWDAIGSTVEDIREVGAGWIAIHPYGVIRGDGTVVFRTFEADRPPAHLVRPIREAHDRGLQILIKPHLAYWGSPFSWRGEIEFSSDEQWERFWSSYRRWIVQVARACRDADGFVVGTELDRTLRFGERWREIIAAVREVTDAPLTYAANWSDYRDVTFWDALDVIGVQAYFPLTSAPTSAAPDLAQAWQRWMAELREFASGANRKVVFTELGYSRSMEAPVRPWAYGVDGPEAEPVQESCLRVALRAIEAEPTVVGVFLWKWFPNPHPVGRDFQLATPRLKRAIREVWN